MCRCVSESTSACEQVCNRVRDYKFTHVHTCVCLCVCQVTLSGKNLLLLERACVDSEGISVSLSHDRDYAVAYALMREKV
jgi:phosphopantetheinyl transferase (holo-ACP synthase)